MQVGSSGLSRGSLVLACLNHRLQYPLVNVSKKLWKITMLLMGKSPISMGIFNSYVKFPEGNWDYLLNPQQLKIDELVCRVRFAASTMVPMLRHGYIARWCQAVSPSCVKKTTIVQYIYNIPSTYRRLYILVN